MKNSKLCVYLIALSLMLFTHFANAVNLSSTDQKIILNQILPQPSYQVRSVAFDDNTIVHGWKINNQQLFREFSQQIDNSKKPKFATTFLHHIMKINSKHILVLFGTFVGETPEDALPERNSCHACVPILGMALFIMNSSTEQYDLRVIRYAVSAMEQYGLLPEPEKFELAIIGKNQLGLKIYHSDNGHSGEYNFFTLIHINDQFNILLHNIEIGHKDNCAGTGNSICEDRESTVKINETNPNLEFYPIEIHAKIKKYKVNNKGKEKIISNKKSISYYRFNPNKSKYELVK